MNMGVNTGQNPLEDEVMEMIVVRTPSSDEKTKPSDIAKAYLEFMIENKKKIEELNSKSQQESVRKKLNEIGIKIPQKIPFFFTKHPTGLTVWIIKGNEVYHFAEQFNVLFFSAKDKDSYDGKTIEADMDNSQSSLTVRPRNLIHYAEKNEYDEIVKKLQQKLTITVKKDFSHFSSVFTEQQKKIIDEYSPDKNGYKIVVSLPFLDVEDDKIFSFTWNNEQIILTSC